MPLFGCAVLFGLFLGPAQALVLGTNSDISAAPGPGSMMAESTIAVTDPAFAGGLNLDPTDQGLATLAEALREDAALRNLLRDVLPPAKSMTDPLELDNHRSALGPLSAEFGEPIKSQAGAASRARATAGFEDPVIGIEDDGGLSLRQVLHDTAPGGPRRTKRTAKAGGAADDYADDIDVPGLDLSATLLNSRLLGQAMAQVLGATSADFDNGTLIFGVGPFELSIGTEDHSLILSDASGNGSIALASVTPPDLQTGSPQGRAENVDIMGLAMSYVRSPTGVAISICAAALLLLWTTVRTMMRMRR